MADVPGKLMIPSGSKPFRESDVLILTGSTHEIDSSITQLQHHLSMFPRFDPRRHEDVLSLGAQRFLRYTPSNQREDLDKALVHLTESILLSPPFWLQRGPDILAALFLLASALFLRSKVSKQPEEAISATKYFFHLRDQPQEILGTSRHRVTASVVEALALQVMLEAGNVMQNIWTMAVLCHELLTLKMSNLASDVDAADLIHHIHAVVQPKILDGFPDQPLDELIECLRAAKRHRPDVLEGHVALAVSLSSRYSKTWVDDDYKEAVSVLDEIIAYRSPGNSQDESVAKYRGFATVYVASMAIMRSDAYENPEYLEEAIYRTRTCFSSADFMEHYHQSLRFDLEDTAKKRLKYFGSDKEVEGWHGTLQSELVVSEDRLKSMKLLILGIRNNDDTTNIHEAIEQGRSILASSPDVDTLNFFSDALDEAFDRTKKIEYLNESISVRRQVIESPHSYAGPFRTLGNLSLGLLRRSDRFPGYHTQDVNEGLDLLSKCVHDARGSFPNRLRLALLWTLYARRHRHTSVSTAYETTLSLIQDAPLFSPTLQLQHTTLIRHVIIPSFPLDYASYQLDHHQLEEAIETLERGRSLLWSEMRHLRVSIDPLLEVDPDLGHKFAAVNRNLEELTKSVPPSYKLNMEDSAADDLRAADPFGRLLLKQRNLLKERTKLISQIQSLPGFDGFLASPSFNRLRSVASSGPVIIINHSEWRSDILILLHNMPPSLIPTPHDFYERTNTLKNKLLESRHTYGLDSEDHADTLAYVLAELYSLVGQPVIDRLRQLQVPEQSRIWWCPTSVFHSLPLHAMGPIPSDDGEPRYFLDLYICSYTPTLSALSQSRDYDTGSQSLCRPSILIAAQLDPSLPTVMGEVQVLQALDTEVSSLLSEAATPATVIDGLHHHQFVHFACHGTLETGNPFKSGFELYGDARLTLLDIVRAHLPAAEFAFLSACHTAEMAEGSIMDEGLHLAAAVQYCGFRSVVGTMWAMADIDGRDLAKYFYKELFSDSSGMPYHERSAKALQFAVKKLRRKRGITLERSVNFVHYGA